MWTTKLLAVALAALTLVPALAFAKGGYGGRGYGSGKSYGSKSGGISNTKSYRAPRSRAPKVYSSKPSGMLHAAPRNPHSISGRSARVHDGDTFYAQGQAYRLRGIDTPELGQPGSQAARQRLQQLLQSGSVTVTPRAVDRYGRTVADVHVNGRNAADIMNAEGLAK